MLILNVIRLRIEGWFSETGLDSSFGGILQVYFDTIVVCNKSDVWLVLLKG